MNTTMNIEDLFPLSDDEKKDALNDDGLELNEGFLFNEKNFNTIILQSKESQDNQQKKQILDVEKFIQQYNNISEKNDLLLWLKQNNFKHLLTDQIQSITDEKLLTPLICAYWEAGFDDWNDLLIFIPHLVSNNLSIALEARSAIEGLARPFKEDDVHQALQIIESKYDQLSTEVRYLVDDIVELLKSELSSNE
ncbi:MAG: hypothetical protein N3F62_00660 [Bacteroidia bacterium]|nr:hypothetical protein [Bacteroidia bacterium]